MIIVTCHVVDSPVRHAQTQLRKILVFFLFYGFAIKHVARGT